MAWVKIKSCNIDIRGVVLAGFQSRLFVKFSLIIHAKCINFMVHNLFDEFFLE